MENLKNLEKIVKIFQPQNIITSEEIDQVLKGIMEILASYKKGTDAINEETKAVVNSLLEQTIKYNQETISEFKSEAEKAHAERMKELQGFLSEVKTTLGDMEVMMSEVKDGKDADEERVIGEVINRIKIDPTVVTMSAEEVRDKLASLKDDDRLDKSAIKGLEKVLQQKDLDYAIATLQHQASFLINKGGLKNVTAGTNVTIDYTDPSNPVISSTGGGSIAIGDTITSATQGSILFAGASGVLAQDNSSLFFDDTNNRLGLLTTAPTHTLTLGSTSTGISLYNTADQTTNYERLRMYYSGNTGYISSEFAGSGTLRQLYIRATASSRATEVRIFAVASSTPHFDVITTSAMNVAGGVFARIKGDASNSSGDAANLSLTPTYTQSGTAGYTALLVNPTENTTGSGTKSLILAQVGGVDKFSVANTGITTITNTTDAASNQVMLIQGDRATPAVSDEIYQSFQLSNSSGTQKEMARQTIRTTNVTAGAEAGEIRWSIMSGGTLSGKLYLNSARLSPVTNDGVILGASGAGFSDLYIASGGIIDWNSGNYTLTHSTGVLTANKDFRITSANVGTNADSVPTLSSTSTLTNKTISGASNTITNIPVSALSFSGAKAYRTTDVSLTTSTWTTIDLDNETYDTDTYHDNVTNPSRITIPSTAKYRFTACAEFTANKGHGIRLLKNGSAIEGASSTAGNSGVTEGSSVVWEDDFTSADYIQVQVVGTTASTSCTYASLSVQKLS